MWFAYFSVSIETKKINKREYPPVWEDTPKPTNLPTQWKQIVEHRNTLSNANEFQHIPSIVLVTS